jgi:hypothetical protein
MAKAKAKAKAKTRGLAKAKGKAKRDDASAGSNTLLFPVFEVRDFHRMLLDRDSAIRGAVWENLDLEPPPGAEESLDEAYRLLAKERELTGDKLRQETITLEATLDLTAYTRPLGIDDAGGFEQTNSLFLTILTLTQYVGLIYKDRFSRPRPNEIETRLRPFLAIPPHASYPSNHAYQSFAIADVFSELAESERAVAELYRSARRVAENREYAGLHFESDTEAGRQLAKLSLPYLIEALDEPMFRAQQEWL